MATSTVNPTSGASGASGASTGGFPKDQNSRVQVQILNDRFEKVTLVKAFDPSIASGVESVKDALLLLGGDTEKLIQILKTGLIAQERARVKATDGGWYDKEKETIYSGARLDGEKVNSLVLGLAKSSYSKVYATDPSKAKDMARDYLKSDKATPLLAGLVVDSETE